MFAVTAPATSTLRVLLVSPQVEDHRRLKEILPDSEWHFRGVRTWEEAAHVLQNETFCAVISEASLDSCTWREVLAGLRRGESIPRLIVASQFADEALWSEVLNLGGYDVLAKPFEPREVSWVIQNACRDWADEAEAS